MTSNAKLDALRALLLDDDRKERQDIASQLEAVHTLVTTREELEPKVEPIIDDKLESFAKSIPAKLGPAITAALKTEISNSQDQVVDVLYPIIGKMIKKYLRYELGIIKEQIDKGLRKAFSWQGMKLRVKAFMSGNSAADMIIHDVNGARVEEMMVIENHSGLLKGSYAKEETIDRDMVAGMLTAIKSFVEDAFNAGTQDLEHIQYESFNIHLYPFASFYIAVVVSGMPDAKYKAELQNGVMSWAEKYLKQDQDHAFDEGGQVPLALEHFFS